MNGWIHLSVCMFLIRCVMCRSAPPPTASEVRAPGVNHGAAQALLSSLTLVLLSPLSPQGWHWASYMGSLAGQGMAGPLSPPPPTRAVKSEPQPGAVEEQSIVDCGGVGIYLHGGWVPIHAVRSFCVARSESAGGWTKTSQTKQREFGDHGALPAWSGSYETQPCGEMDTKIPPAVEEENSTF
jgi:hypothetical protein